MSKHNNSLNSSMSARCKCGRYITIGEEYGGIGWVFGYTCPTCLHHEHVGYPIREQYYKSFGL